MSLQPTCILCLSLCDRNGCLTSCEHFFCTRCMQRLRQMNDASSSKNGRPVAQVCPVCKKQGYQVFPLHEKSIQPLFQNPITIMHQNERVLASQLSHYRQIHQRMSEALKVLNTKHQNAERALKVTKRELHDTKETLRTVQQFTQRQRKEIDVLSRAASQNEHTKSHVENLSAAYPGASRQLSEDPQWVTMMMQRPSSQRVSPSASAAPRKTPPHAGGLAPPFASLGWSTTSSVLKRPRDNEPSAASSSPPYPPFPHFPSPAGHPVGTHSSPRQANSPAPVPPSPSLLLSTPLVQSLHHHYNGAAASRQGLPIPTPSPLRGLLNTSLLHK